MLMHVYIQLCCARCEGARQSIYKVQVKYQRLTGLFFITKYIQGASLFLF